MAYFSPFLRSSFCEVHTKIEDSKANLNKFKNTI